MKKLVTGILAHADAGKTTLSEGLLYVSGKIRKLGRVDKKDAFLDTFELERQRGITIFSKQAVFPLNDVEVTLLDTPGHVDFSAEMERTLGVLDYGILVISGADGVQGHTETLWRLLERYQVPVFLFVNKMDQDGTEGHAVMEELKKRLDSACVDFGTGRGGQDFLENVAVCDEQLMEAYLEQGEVNDAEIVRLIRERKLFPCYFGSALKLTGIREFMEGLSRYTICRDYPEEFGARVYKISRDEQGSRLTHLKVTGGSLKVKDALAGDGKVNQVRIYSGAKFESVEEAPAGTICAVTGLSHTYPGAGLGLETGTVLPVLEPVLHYRMELPEGADVHGMLQNLRILEEEEPLLHIVWDETLKEIRVQLMGEVQIEVLKSLVRDRFGVSVEFGPGSIVYKETIAEPVEGVGHFEPLRHYAEVHLLLEPGERGSGLQVASALREDELDLNWQRLVCAHLEEREHKGVLTGSPITDLKITLVGGRAHIKHTEGGDFRQATYRAVRQGLMKAKSVLLEPYYEFRLEVPSECAGRAMADIRRMCGDLKPPQTDGERTILTGSVPVAAMQGYHTEMVAYTKGRGHLFCALKGYEPCHNAKQIIEAAGYDSQRDLENPAGSVLCAHGAGFVVPWDQVEEYMHVESSFKPESGAPKERAESETPCRQKAGGAGTFSKEEEKELEQIMTRMYGPKEAGKKFGRQKHSREKVSYDGEDGEKGRRVEAKPEAEEEYLLVDGYNVIYAWDRLKKLAEVNMDGARGALMDILSDYQGFRKCHLIVVFDAYKLEDYPGEVLRYHNIDVVYTKTAETADQYIEKTAHAIGRKYRVTVATSDGTEQVIIRGQGCHLLSARELEEEVERVRQQIREEYMGEMQGNRNYLFHYLDDDMAEYMEKVRLGKQT